MPIRSSPEPPKSLYFLGGSVVLGAPVCRNPTRRSSRVTCRGLPGRAQSAGLSAQEVQRLGQSAVLSARRVEKLGTVQHFCIPGRQKCFTVCGFWGRSSPTPAEDPLGGSGGRLGGFPGRSGKSLVELGAPISGQVRRFLLQQAASNDKSRPKRVPEEPRGATFDDFGSIF